MTPKVGALIAVLVGAAAVTVGVLASQDDLHAAIDSETPLSSEARCHWVSARATGEALKLLSVSMPAEGPQHSYARVRICSEPKSRALPLPDGFEAIPGTESADEDAGKDAHAFEAYAQGNKDAQWECACGTGCEVMRLEAFGKPETWMAGIPGTRFEAGRWRIPVGGVADGQICIGMPCSGLAGFDPMPKECQ